MMMSRRFSLNFRKMRSSAGSSRLLKTRIVLVACARSTDSLLAAQMIETYAKERTYSFVLKHKLSTIRTATMVVARCFGVHPDQRKNVVHGKPYPRVAEGGGNRDE